MNADILAKVRKLLRLAQSDNPNEAALAAAKAQQLIDANRLTAAMLAMDGEPEVDEPIRDFGALGAPLDDLGYQSARLPIWRGMLAVVLCEANACKPYQQQSTLQIIGRPSDVETVRYLYAYLVREIERLTGIHGAGMGVSWRNSFRLGVVDAIKVKLKEQRSAFREEQRQQAGANPYALARVERALERVDQRRRDIEEWVARHMRLTPKSRHATYRRDAREQGRAAGANIRIGGGPALGSGPRGYLGGVAR